ncbi:MAG: IS630 family transposase [Aphanizomenon flos-aquae KM1D3_PB]|uniref:IS630 family transposase n=1 Tax=Aphanizomenon flos-aquae TaxID=1176 RepID=UPI00126A0653|nr:IS630 family transposase [Aphanizomenon flos-aquae]QSV70789.1 MAG: IS630 family transposase [Aphanizomenon flos-aquae KM1D3_PB]QSV73645.1 MAG: IS630 family transposase [Aphanizomenon flos-aquae KM1D3_PB]
MPAKRYIVSLTGDERQSLEKLIRTGIAAAAKINHAHILLKADVNHPDGGWKDQAISDVFKISTRTIERVRQRFVEESLENALVPRQRHSLKLRRLDGEAEAHLVATVCSSPPEGYSRWTLRLLADQIVVLGYVESISHESVRQVPKKNEIKPWLKESWVIPPEANAEFVCQMEDILQLYTRPYDPDYPLVCFDETSKQLISEVREPLPPEPGQVERYDYEYKREGVCNIFMMFEPLVGWRHAEVTDQRTQIDYAQQIKYLVDECYPHAKKIQLAQDNLNTHVRASLYKAFPPDEARRILDKIEFHYTPKHGSWLNMAEIELSVLNRQCLDRRIAEKEVLKQEIAAWEKRRNELSCKVDWQFTTQDARIKLKRLYPSISS